MDTNKLKFKSLLFVSSDTNEELHAQLNNIFKSVHVETNHEASVETYFGSNRTSDVEVDLLLYDIIPENIIHLAKIRDLNQKIPILVISDDYTNIDAKLLTQQRVYHSFSKPLNEESFAAQSYYALKEVSKRKFNAYLRQVAMVSKTDATGKIIYANDLFCDISGYTKEELMDQKHSIVRHASNPKSLYETMWNTISSGNAWHGIIKNQRKDGKEYYINSTIFPTFNSKQEIIGYLNIAFEVTEEEQNKAKLKHYILSQKSAQIKNNKEFEEKVALRVQQAIKEEKIKQIELKKIIFELEDSLNHANINKKQLKSHIHYLEESIKKISEKDRSTENQLKHMLRETRQEQYETHKKNEKLEKQNDTLTEKLEKAQESIQVFQNYVDEYRKKIDDLNDVIASYEKGKK